MNYNNMSTVIDQPPLFIGDSSGITNIRNLSELFAPTDDPVLITGETGTGKEISAPILPGTAASANSDYASTDGEHLLLNREEF